MANRELKKKGNFLDPYPPEDPNRLDTREDAPPYDNNTVMKPGEPPMGTNPNPGTNSYPYQYPYSYPYSYPYNTDMNGRYVSFSK